MKSLKLGDVVWVDGYKSTIRSLPNKDGEMQLTLDGGLWTESTYSCNIRDISVGDDGDFVLDVEFSPMVGDTVRVNDEEHKLIAIDKGVITIQRNDVVSYYSLSDVNYDIIDGYWVSSLSQQVFSPTVRRKLEVYEVQDNVYLYTSLEELKEIYELLNKPSIQGVYGIGDYSCIDVFIDSLQHGHGLIHYWENWDSEWDYTYKYMKVIEGGCIKGNEQCTN